MLLSIRVRRINSRVPCGLSGALVIRDMEFVISRSSALGPGSL